eukprot:scaffold97819_cov57-Phaeocystis_antarctica.AAC.2
MSGRLGGATQGVSWGWRNKAWRGVQQHLGRLLQDVLRGGVRVATLVARALALLLELVGVDQLTNLAARCSIGKRRYARLTVLVDTGAGAAVSKLAAMAAASAASSASSECGPRGLATSAYERLPPPMPPSGCTACGDGAAGGAWAGKLRARWLAGTGRVCQRWSQLWQQRWVASLKPKGLQQGQ